MLHSFAAQPTFGTREKLARHRVVVDRIEKAEEARLVFVSVKVLAIDLRGNATNAFPITVRREDRPLRVLEERVLFWIEPILQIHIERPNEVRIIAINV